MGKRWQKHESKLLDWRFSVLLKYPVRTHTLISIVYRIKPTAEDNDAGTSVCAWLRVTDLGRSRWTITSADFRLPDKLLWRFTWPDELRPNVDVT